MKIRYHKLGLLLDIAPGETLSLVLESPEACENFLIDYHDYIEKNAEELVFFDEEKELKFSKNCVLITGPLDLNYNSRDMQKKLYAELAELAFDYDLLESMNELHGQQLALMEQLALASDESLSFDYEFCLADVLKMFRVELKNPEGRFAEKLVDFITTNHRLLGKTFFLLANCDVYLKETDYHYLKELAHHREVQILFLGQRPPSLQADMQTVIIDEEMCEIHGLP